MHRRSKTLNAPLEDKENENPCTEEKKEASCPGLSKEHEICKVTKSKVITAPKENFSDGTEVQLQKHTLSHTKGLQKELYHGKEGVERCRVTECPFDRLKGDVAGERTLPLDSKESVPSSRPLSLGDERYLTPKRDTTEAKPDCGMLEKQRKTPVDFTAITIAEFGITQESFTKPSLGRSPSALKYRRRSTIGVRGSPENNTLIQFLGQQRSNRQKEAFTEVIPFKYDHVRSLKDKIDAFQTSFTLIEEAEGEAGFPGRSQGDDASQEAGSSQDKGPFMKEGNLYQWSETFTSDSSRADLEENLRQNLTDSSVSDTKIFTTLSSWQDVTITEAAVAVSKEWVDEQHNPTESLEAVLIRDTLETSHDFSSDHITKDIRMDVGSDLSRKKVSFLEEWSLEIFDESKPLTPPPCTPLRTGNTPSREHPQSGSCLRSVLKKTPVKPLVDSTKEYFNNMVDRGGGEFLAVSSSTEIFETLKTEEAERCSSEKPKKKRVTFGEVLSPEIFDEALPANAPLHRGGTPVRQARAQDDGPSAWASLGGEPLPQPNFNCDEECVEPLQELAEGPVAAEALLPVENAKAAETDKSDRIKTRSSTKSKQCSSIAEETNFSISTGTTSKNAKEAKNPRKNKLQRQKNTTAAPAKKTQKTKHTSYGKKRKKKVKKSLYGEREMASKKPLLSPIPEIPEVLSSASSPNSPKANALLSEDVLLANARSGDVHKDAQQKPVVRRTRRRSTSVVHMCGSSKDLDIAEASSSRDMVLQVSDGDLEAVSGVHHEFSNIVPDAKWGFEPSDYSQEGKETPWVKEAKESVSLIKNEQSQGNLHKAAPLTGQESLEQEGTGVHEGAQRTRCLRKDSARGLPSRRRRGRSSAISFPSVENLEITGNNLLISSFNVEEVLSAPQPFRRKSDNCGEKRVRRSMRLHKGAEMEGLAWVQVPSETQKNPLLLASARKIRRTVSTSILTESENIHRREQNLSRFSVLGKNDDSVHLADDPCQTRRRKSICVSTPQETRAWSQTRKRSITNTLHRRDRSNRKHYEDVEISLENNSNISEVSATSDFLK